MSSVRQNDMPDTLVEWLIFGLIALVTAVLCILFDVLATGVKKLFAAVRGKPVEKVMDDDQVLSALSAATSEASDPKVPSTGNQAGQLIWDAEEPEAAEIRRIELNSKAAVVFRFYPNKGEVSGKLSVTSRTLQKALGKDLRINAMPCTSLVEASQLMTAKANAILQSVSPSAVKQKKVASPVEPMEGPPDYLDVPMSAYLDDMAAHADKEDRMLEPPPMGESTPPASTAPATVPKRSRGPVKVQVKYRGRIVSFGKENRQMDDNTVKKHYCVRIIDDDLKSEVAHWGNDLQRAVSEAGVAIGDRVEMGVVGNVPIALAGGATGRKTMWAMEKL